MCNCVKCGKKLYKYLDPWDCENIEGGFNFRGNIYCNECLHEIAIRCQSCGDWHLKEEIHEVQISNYFGELEDTKICDYCINAYTEICDHCGRRTWRNTIYTASLNGVESAMCSACLHQNSQYRMCDSCGVIFYEDELVFSEDGDYDDVFGDEECLCRSCVDNRIRRRAIKNYSYKPSPRFFDVTSDGECLGCRIRPYRDLYMGVELEVDKGIDQYSCANELLEITNAIYCKHDGSLTENGFEIVSHPATLSAHMNGMRWDEIVNKCKEYKFKSHDAKTCGLHVHVSRDFFSNNNHESFYGDDIEFAVARLIIITNLLFDDYIFPFSRRIGPELERYAKKNTIPVDDVMKSYKTDAEKCKKITYDNYTSDRYRIINITNERTVEFRMFRGTLNLNTFFATLQLVDKICRMAKTFTLEQAYNVTWGDVTKGMPDEFNEYCEKIFRNNTDVCGD